MTNSFGSFLFLIAVGGNLLALALCMGSGIYRMATGGAKLPASEGDLAPIQGKLKLEVDKGSVLATRKERVGPDPVAKVGEDSYRVTWLGDGRYLVTKLADSRRIGTFELAADGGAFDVVAHPDDEGQDVVLLQIARAANREAFAHIAWR